LSPTPSTCHLPRIQSIRPQKSALRIWPRTLPPPFANDFNTRTSPQHQPCEASAYTSPGTATPSGLCYTRAFRTKNQKSWIEREYMPFFKMLPSVVVVLCCCPELRASTILLGTQGSGGGVPAVASCCFVAQGFTLGTSVNISSIDLFMTGFGTDPFTIWVTNAIGSGTTVGNVLLQQTNTFPNTGGGPLNASWVSTATNLSLTAGNYFLVLSSMQNSVSQGWFLSALPASTLPSSVGSVGANSFSSCCATGSSTNTSFAPASQFTAGRPMLFQIQGAPAAVPEPSTALLSIIGLFIVAVLRVVTWSGPGQPPPLP
jgi:hypothetical protein